MKKCKLTPLGRRTFPNLKDRVGYILKEKDENLVYVLWEGNVTSYTYHKDFIMPLREKPIYVQAIEIVESLKVDADQVVTGYVVQTVDLEKELVRKFKNHE